MRLRTGVSFKKEWGAMLDVTGNIFHLIEGSTGHVDFPGELIWQIHKKTPGYLYGLVHTHPPEMYQLSHEDEIMLKAWTIALYPYPARLATLTLSNRFSIDYWVLTNYQGFLEPLSNWLARKKEGERKFEIIITEPTITFENILKNPIWIPLIEKSYGNG